MRLTIIGSALLSYVFLSFGLFKLLKGPAATVVALASLGFGQPTIVLSAARLLPWMEIALGLWLLSGFRGWHAACVALLVLCFLSAIALLLGVQQGWGAPCSCGGALLGEAVGVSLVRNLLLAVLAACLVIRGKPASRALAPLSAVA